jgi:hypothetical protein
MCHNLLRLSTALLTFTVGITASHSWARYHSPTVIKAERLQAAAPLHISDVTLNHTGPDTATISFVVKNRSTRPVSRYTIGYCDGSGCESGADKIHINVTSLRPGHSVPDGFGGYFPSDDPRNLTLTIDSVSFVDGSTWEREP